MSVSLGKKTVTGLTISASNPFRYMPSLSSIQEQRNLSKYGLPPQKERAINKGLPPHKTIKEVLYPKGICPGSVLQKGSKSRNPSKFAWAHKKNCAKIPKTEN